MTGKGLPKGDNIKFSPLASGPEGLSPSWRALRAGSRHGGRRGVRRDFVKIFSLDWSHIVKSYIPSQGLRLRRASLRGMSPSLRAGGLSEPEAGAEPGSERGGLSLSFRMFQIGFS